MLANALAPTHEKNNSFDSPAILTWLLHRALRADARVCAPSLPLSPPLVKSEPDRPERKETTAACCHNRTERAPAADIQPKPRSAGECAR